MVKELNITLLKLLLIASLVTTLLLLTGCATPAPIVTQIELSVPVEPAYPRLTAEDLNCLTQDAYERLATRDREKRQYIQILKAIIESTKKPPPAQ